MLKIALLLSMVKVFVSSDDEVCKVQYLDTPIASKDGDFIIGGLFQIGRLSYTANGTVQHCSYEDIDEFNIQKAVVLRMLIEKESKRFQRDFNQTLGYEMYDTCMSAPVSARVASKLIQNKKVMGVSSVDMKSLIKRSAGLTASFHIPTFVYMFNDDELMSSKDFPTVFSMIDTEIKEAEITIRFLEKMGFEYMDIWYHKFSKDMAEHVYDSYVKKVGCGRITDVTYSSHIPRIKETYNKTGGTPSRVQLILQNSYSTTKKILREMVDNLGFRDKIYIFGLSNGRLRYLDAYKEILSTSGDNTLIFPLPDLLNVQLNQTLKYINKDWRFEDVRDFIDVIYTYMQSYRCPKDEENFKDCKTTSWLPYMIGGVQLILNSLYSLLEKIESLANCSMDYGTELFREIVKEDRVLEVSLEENITLPIAMRDKTINNGYRIGVYRSMQNKFRILGKGFFDHLEVEDMDLLDSITVYNKTCSHTCPPGSHRFFNTSVQYVPCCWTCLECKVNHISTEENSDFCKSCDATMSSTENRTACVTIPETFIRPNSTAFIVGKSCIPLGVIMVISFGIIIFRNEDRPLIKASDPGYLYMMLLSLFIGYCTALIPLYKPSFSICSAEYYSFIAFATLISINLLLKCVKVYDIFAAAQRFAAPRLGSLLKRTGQTTINLLFIAVTITILIVDAYTGSGPSWAFTRHQNFPHGALYLMCSCVSGKILAISVAIPCASFLITLFLAFKMRKFPHNFRESLNIFCATFVVLLCYIMFMSGYSFSSPEIRPILRSIVVFITSSAFLLCLFVPKLIVLWDRNMTIEQERMAIQEEVGRFSGKNLSVCRSTIRDHTVNPRADLS